MKLNIKEIYYFLILNLKVVKDIYFNYFLLSIIFLVFFFLKLFLVNRLQVDPYIIY